MPPRPFPFALRIGTDIVNQIRIRGVITRTTTPNRRDAALHAFLRRLLTPREQRAFWLRHQAFDTTETSRLPAVAEYLSGRWAAKEAAIKAVKPRQLTFQDVEILREPQTGELYALIRDHPSPRGGLIGHAKGLRSNPPDGPEDAQSSSIADGNALDPESNAQPEDQDDPAGQIAQISISHDSEYATAVCLAAEEPIPGDVGGEASAQRYQ